MRCNFLQQLTTFYKPKIKAAFIPNPNVTKNQYFPTMEGPPWSSCGGHWHNRQWFSPQGRPLREVESDATFWPLQSISGCSCQSRFSLTWHQHNTAQSLHNSTGFPYSFRFVVNAALLWRGLFIWSQCYCIYTWELLKERPTHPVMRDLFWGCSQSWRFGRNHQVHTGVTH